MKNFKFYLLLVFFPLFLTSCSRLNPQEKMLLGKWYCVEHEDFDKDDMTGTMLLEGTIQYKKDNTFKTEGKLTCMMGVESDEWYNSKTETLKYTYSVFYSGTWEIKDGYLHEECTNVTINLIDVKSSLDLSKKEMEELREYAIEAIPEMKSEVLGESTDSKITELTPLKCTIIDEDGIETTYKRISE